MGVTFSPSELGRILAKASIRQRVPIAFEAFTRVRPKTLGNKKGDDGLEIRDLLEMMRSWPPATVSE